MVRFLTEPENVSYFFKKTCVESRRAKCAFDEFLQLQLLSTSVISFLFLFVCLLRHDFFLYIMLDPVLFI